MGLSPSRGKDEATNTGSTFKKALCGSASQNNSKNLKFHVFTKQTTVMEAENRILLILKNPTSNLVEIFKKFDIIIFKYPAFQISQYAVWNCFCCFLVVRVGTFSPSSSQERTSTKKWNQGYMIFLFTKNVSLGQKQEKRVLMLKSVYLSIINICFGFCLGYI